MTEIFNFIFDNFLLFGIILMIYYIYKEYKELKEKTKSINDLFEKSLNKYIEEKINNAKQIASRLLNEYGHEEMVSTEINRLLLVIEKGITGTINDKVTTSNSLNKFKLNKKIDLEKYPNLKKLENLGTFTEEELESVENGLAIARKEYNAEAFRYNEKAGTFIMQYLTKLLKLNQQYTIFDAPKSSFYEENFEVFEEEEPEINSLSSLNRQEETKEENLNDLLYHKQSDKEEITIEHSDLILKPSNDIKEDEKRNYHMANSFNLSYCLYIYCTPFSK